jgi:hypothetical protein
MKVLFIALLLSTSFISQVRSETVAPAATALSDRDRIKVDRAKAAAEEKNSTTARPWDRNSNGKRPWDIALPAAPK